jgi:8-oxo-dGTP pyrophosphatase MutT (NUDIX family)
MELLDIYDETGQPTGKVIQRGARLSADQNILVVQLWIRIETGEYLIQQRAHHLEDAPGIWATTAGHVQSGEESLDGALRELNEEMGIQIPAQELHRYQRIIRKNLIQDVWLAEVNSNTLEQPVIGTEVADWMWASREKIQDMVRQGLFFPYRYLNEFLT